MEYGSSARGYRSEKVTSSVFSFRLRMQKSIFKDFGNEVRSSEQHRRTPASSCRRSTFHRPHLKAINFRTRSNGRKEKIWCARISWLMLSKYVQWTNELTTNELTERVHQTKKNSARHERFSAACHAHTQLTTTQLTRITFSTGYEIDCMTWTAFFSITCRRLICASGRNRRLYHQIFGGSSFCAMALWRGFAMRKVIIDRWIDGESFYFALFVLFLYWSFLRFVPSVWSVALLLRRPPD